MQDNKCPKRKFTKQKVSKMQNCEAKIVKKDKFARQKVAKITNLYDLPGLPYKGTTRELIFYLQRSDLHHVGGQQSIISRR